MDGSVSGSALPTSSPRGCGVLSNLYCVCCHRPAGLCSMATRMGLDLLTSGSSLSWLCPRIQLWGWEVEVGWVGCAAPAVPLAEAGKDARPSLGKCQGIQFVIFLLVLPGMCLSTTTKVTAETPCASACPVLLLLAKATCKKARNWSKSPPQETTNTPHSSWSRLSSPNSVPVLRGCGSGLPWSSHPGRIWLTGEKILPSTSLSSWLSFAPCQWGLANETH